MDIGPFCVIAATHA